MTTTTNDLRARTRDAEKEGRRMRLIGRCAFTALTLVMTSAGHASLAGCLGPDGGPGPLDDPPANPGPGNGTDAPPGDGPLSPAPPPAPPPPSSGEVATVGVFASATKGTDDGDGSSEHPVKTLAQAIALAKDKRLPVNACAEAYSEAVTLADGVTMYGYFDCANPSAWKRVEARAHIVSPTSPAVLGENLAAPARFEGFEIEAPDVNGPPVAGTPAASSYGMILRSSKNLAIEDVLIRAGKGQDGLDGAEPAEGNQELSASPNGEASNAGTEQYCYPVSINRLRCVFDDVPATRAGGDGGVSQCKVGANGGPGGRGGDGRIADDGVYRTSTPPVGALAGKPLLPTAGTATGGSTGGGSAGAPSGAAGTDGTTGSWSFTSAGFVPGAGTAGETGKPGQGGGGGAGASYWSWEMVPNPPGAPKKVDGIKFQTGTVATGTGAGGGAGGCGGVAGTPGTGGGASVALFVVGSNGISIAHSQMAARQGGRAGKGTVGTLGTAGGAGGSKVTPTNGSVSGEAGGDGGHGGPSGLSGQGAPGPSIALVFSGTRPETTDVVFAEGTAGEGAPALQRGTQSLAAVTGVAKQEHSF